MRLRSLLEGPPHLAPHRDGAGQKIYGAGMKRARRGRAQELTRRDLESFQRHIHRLELRVARADQRAKRNEPEMVVKPGLARRAGDDGKIVAFLDAMLPEQREDALQHLATPRPSEFLFD